ncbi:hypothetical protein MtrunA17_Chr7g0260471 [Medicago truncatula]|uniref:Uncharacterized protein n=1 Tax=Medicago truncatula TaxID=3880 RepID=A0A396H4F4_MEDTR|nr:hypothetical protein MtrunA17_Chr7g0260471 [Medicago truncatula]
MKLIVEPSIMNWFMEISVAASQCAGRDCWDSRTKNYLLLGIQYTMDLQSKGGRS